MRGKKGYIVEIAGYSATRGQAGIQNSQHMSDAVVRYLAENEIPVYRIHEVAMGNAKIDDSDIADARQCGAREFNAKQFSGLELDAFGRGFADRCDAAVFRAALPSGCCVATIGSTTTITNKARNQALTQRENQGRLAPHPRGRFFALSKWPGMHVVVDLSFFPALPARSRIIDIFPFPVWRIAEDDASPVVGIGLPDGCWPVLQRERRVSRCSR